MSCLAVNSSAKLKDMLTTICSEIALSDVNYVSFEQLNIHDAKQSEFNNMRFIFIELSEQDIAYVLPFIEQFHAITNAPILLLIDAHQEPYIETALNLGAFDYLVAPYTAQQLKLRIQIALKYAQQVEHQRQHQRFLEKDLAIAKSLQKGALTPSLHQKSIQIDGFYITSNTLGGDMYCWFKISPHEFAIILYDVMGHGVASSLITMSIRSLLRGMMTRLKDPELVINELNRHINELYQDEFTESYLVTAIYLLVNTKTKTIAYVNAGHPTGYLMTEDSAITLHANTPILGLLPKLTIKKQEITYSSRQRMILYTDGLQQDTTQQVVAQQFAPYVMEDNAQGLTHFVNDYALASKPQLDDIAIVFITVS